jgi:hypothetical protein
VIVNACQRWRARRTTYRPAGETIDTRRHEVAEIQDDATAKAFVLEHHYEGSYPAAVARFGLYRDGRLAGVAVYSLVWPHVLESACIQAPTVELSRLVLENEVEANAETWMSGQMRRAFARDGRFELILAHSDDLPRVAVDGRIVHVGHVGVIYQASSAVYLGRARRNTLYLLSDGRVFSQRVQSKIRARDRGWRYGVDLLVERGAAPPGPSEDISAWLAHWRAALCRRVRHPGNHRYLIPVTARARRWAPTSLPYPKLDMPVRYR